MSERAIRAALATLSLVGLAIATYLAATRAAGAASVCATGGCETVQSSQYAEVLGAPVAVLAVLAYVAILASALLAVPAAAGLGAAVAFAGAAFSVYLIYLQLAVIDAICMWCVVSDVLMGVIAVFAALRLCSLAAPPAAAAC